MFEVVENIKDTIKSNFAQIQFDATTHTYTLHGHKPTPVSKVVERYYEQFDADGNAMRMAQGDRQKANALKEKWKQISSDACDLGHRVHDFGEKYFYNKALEPSNGYEHAITLWWKQLPKWIVPVLAETRVNYKYIFSGTFDILLYDLQRKGLIIADYKTNKDLFKNFKNKRMLPPFDFLLDSPFNHYAVQLSLYQLPLEELGLNIIDRWIIHLKPEGQFIKHDLIDYTKHLKLVL
jgi:hypothetical protein